MYRAPLVYADSPLNADAMAVLSGLNEAASFSSCGSHDLQGLHFPHSSSVEIATTLDSIRCLLVVYSFYVLKMLLGLLSSKPIDWQVMQEG